MKNLLLGFTGVIPAGVRYFATLGLGALATRGYIDGDTVQAGIAFATGLAVSGVGMWLSKTDNRIKSVADLPNVEVVTLKDGFTVYGKDDTAH